MQHPTCHPGLRAGVHTVFPTCDDRGKIAVSHSPMDPGSMAGVTVEDRIGV